MNKTIIFISFVSGLQDRERIIRELICPRERAEAQRINDITNSHFKSLQIINSIRTDNNENNDIELMPIGVTNFETNSEFMEPQVSTEKNTVQRLIEQFNVDELMQADETANLSGFKIPGEIPKPVKKAAKKYTPALDNPKKEGTQKSVATGLRPSQQKKPSYALDDMMMGDQGEPELIENVPSDEVSNEILEPLPHRKKILPQDLKTMPSITEKPIEHATQTTPLMPLLHSSPAAIDETDFTTTTTPEIITTPVENVAHPIHPQQPHGSGFSETSEHPHIKENLDNSHFIPPMLLVKSHYVPPGRHEHELHSDHHQQLHALPLTTALTTTTTAASTTKPHLGAQPLTTDYIALTSLTTDVVATSLAPLTSFEKTQTSTATANDISVSTTITPDTTTISSNAVPTTTITTTTAGNIKSKETTVAATRLTPTTTTTTSNSQATKVWKTSFEQPKGKRSYLTNSNSTGTTLATPTMPTTAKIALQTSSTTTTTTTKAIKPVKLPQITDTTEARKSAVETSVISATTTTTTTTTNSKDISEESDEQSFERMVARPNDKSLDMEARVAAALAAASNLGENTKLQENLAAEVRTTAAAVATTATSATTKMQNMQQVYVVPSQTLLDDHTQPQAVTETTNAPTTKRTATTTTTTTTTIGTVGEADWTTTRRNFLLAETVLPYKPNRRRMLTKPENPSYIQKILG